MNVDLYGGLFLIVAALAALVVGAAVHLHQTAGPRPFEEPGTDPITPSTTGPESETP